MVRIRKSHNRYWSKEDKLKIINEVLDGKSSYEVARIIISSGMYYQLYKIIIISIILYVWYNYYNNEVFYAVLSNGYGRSIK